MRSRIQSRMEAQSPQDQPQCRRNAPASSDQGPVEANVFRLDRPEALVQSAAPVLVPDLDAIETVPVFADDIVS